MYEKDSSLHKMVDRIAVPGYPPKSDILICGLGEMSGTVSLNYFAVIRCHHSI